MKILLLSLLTVGSLALFRYSPGPCATDLSEVTDQTLPSDWREKTQPAQREKWNALEGRAAPALGGISHWMNTEARSWADLQGKVVVLDYWATWCGPCMRGVPKLKKLQKKYLDKGLVVLGIHSSSRFNPEEMKSVAEANRMNYPLAADPDGQLARKLGVSYLPSYFVIDQKGTLRIAGADHGKLDPIVQALLAEGRGEKPEQSARKAEAPAPSAEKGWPPFVVKPLYAKHDYRGKPAPAIEVGEWLTPEPNREGKVLLLDFWATWCSPCVKLMPELSRWQKEFGDDLVVLGVSNEDAATVRAFLENAPVTYSMAIDEEARMNRKVGVEGIPHVMVISSDGIVRWQGFPVMPEDVLTTAKLRSIIEMDQAVRARRSK